jgi:hypothetical protein
MKHSLFVLFCFACSAPALAQSQPSQAPSAPPAQHFTAAKASGPIVLDGVLDDAAWKTATRVPIRYEIFPGNNTAAHAETTCLVTFDSQRLYIAFDAKDPKADEIRAHYADRDAPFQEDTVGFMLDTFNDGRRAFQFRINARGVQMDAFNSDVDDIEDWSWDAIWEAKTRIAGDGFTVEVAIPFSSLRFPRGAAAQTWGFMAMRDMPRSTRFRMRSNFTDRSKQCLVCQFDKLDGLEGIAPGHNFELDPTVTFARTDERDPFPSGQMAAGDPKPQAGLSARWSITPNIVFSGTANPDFYQVEADAAQLSVNQRFELFFPEKRPFFLEGADIFATPFNMFFSRTIADPNWGVKLSGKQGANAFGVFAAQDDVTGIVIPGFDDSESANLEQKNLSTALRFRRDLGDSGSTIGVMYTGREGEQYSNRTGGVDALVRVTDSDSVHTQVMFSRTQYPFAVAKDSDQPVQPFTGGGFGFQYQHETRNWAWELSHGSLSPEIRLDSGFESQVGVRKAQASIERNFWGGPTRWFNQITIGAGTDRQSDWHGGQVSYGCDFPIEYSGPHQISFSYNPACNHETFNGKSYDNFRQNLSFSIRPTGSFSIGANATWGGAIDFSNSRRADQVRFGANTNFNIARGLEGSGSYTYQKLTVAGGRLFTAQLLQTRVLYHINLRTFIRAIVQYTDVDRDPNQYFALVIPRSRRVFTQLLFNYKLNPQTVLLLGYSDNANGTTYYDLTRSDRTVFVKLGYAFVF